MGSQKHHPTSSYGFTKAPFHLILTSKVPALRSPRRKWENSRAKAHPKTKSKKETAALKKEPAGSVKVHWVAAERGEAPACGPRSRRAPQQRSAQNQDHMAQRVSTGEERKAPFLQGRQYMTGVWMQSVTQPVWPFSLFQICSEKDTAHVFLQHGLLADPGRGGTHIPGQLEAKGHPTQTYTQNWGFKINREAKRTAYSKRLICSFVQTEPEARHRSLLVMSQALLLFKAKN